MNKKIFISLAALAVYVFALSPTIFVGDSPELITAAKTLSAAHPPGYASFAVITKAFMELLPFGNTAYRANLANAVYLFLTLLLLARFLRTEPLVYFALAPIVFSAALACEVFALNALFASATVFLLAETNKRSQLAAAFIFGIGLANQQTLILITPAVLFLLAKRKNLTGVFAAKLLMTALIGFSVTLLLIIRAKSGAAFNWGNPHSWPLLWRHLMRKDYGTFALHGGRYSVSPSALFSWARLGLAFFGPLFLFAPAAYLSRLKSHDDFTHFVFLSFFFTGPFFYVISGLSSPNFDFVKAIMERFFLLPSVFAVILFEKAVGDFKLRKLFRAITALLAVSFVFEIPSGSLRNFYSLSDMTDSVLRFVPRGASLIVQKGAVGDDMIFALAYKKWGEAEPVPEIYSYYGAVFPTVYGNDFKKSAPAERYAAEARFYASGGEKCFFAFSPQQIPLPNYGVKGLVWLPQEKSSAAPGKDVFWRLSDMKNYRVRSLEILFYYFQLIGNPDIDKAEVCEYKGRDIDWLLTNLGPVWAALGNTAKTKDVYLKSLIINPNLPETHNNLGVLYYNEGNYTASARHFRQSLSYEKDNVRFYNLGLALNKMGKKYEAHSAFVAALAINPYNYKAINEVGLIEMDSGNPEYAAELFRKGLKMNPSDENLKFNLILAEKKWKKVGRRKVR